MPEGLTPDQVAFWAAFCASPGAPPDAEARFHSVFGVGSGTDAGAALILSGAKTATSSRPGDFGAEGAPIPGSLSLLTGAGGAPRAVVETVAIRLTCLADMDADFARAYAEWLDLPSFRAGIRDWYRGEDPNFTDQSPLLAEILRVVWAPG
jgi:uncharacterized protein YhfF